MDLDPTNATDVLPTQTEQAFHVSPLMRTLFVCYYSVVFTVAVSGNCFALVACYKNYSVSAAVILSYIASLASADLIFALLSTFDLVFFLRGDWFGGETMCKIQSYLIEMSYTASILTLLAISYERKKAVSTKILARSQGVKRRHYILKVIWLAAIFSCAPLLYAYTVSMKDGMAHCVNTAWGDIGRQIYYTIQAVALFLVPIGVMVWAHLHIFRALKTHVRATSKTLTDASSSSKGSRRMTVGKNRQKQVTKMLFAVTLAFCLCYVPFMVMRTLRYFHIYTEDSVWKLVQLMIFTQTAFNPIIYCFYGRMFKISFRDILRCRFDCLTGEHERRNRGSSLTSSTSNSINQPNTFSISHVTPSTVKPFVK